MYSKLDFRARIRETSRRSSTIGLDEGMAPFLIQTSDVLFMQQDGEDEGNISIQKSKIGHASAESSFSTAPARHRSCRSRSK